MLWAGRVCHIPKLGLNIPSKTAWARCLLGPKLFFQPQKLGPAGAGLPKKTQGLGFRVQPS